MDYDDQEKFDMLVCPAKIDDSQLEAQINDVVLRSLMLWKWTIEQV